MLPSPDLWHRWRVDVHGELHAGKQSRVFDAALDGARVAVKLTDARLVDRPVVVARLAAVNALGARHSDVVPPIRIDGAMVQSIGGWLMTATAFVDGNQLDASAGDDAKLLGRSLARLHEAMRQLEPFEIPPVAALVATGQLAGRSGWQLLHGDFSTQNVIVTPTGLRVFDFDDCGYGPIEYDIANSLYMVLFDSDVMNHPDSYEAFRPAFLEGYSDGSGGVLDEAAIDEMIGIRIQALGRWLENLTTAPIGIRNSSPDWLATLASFVRRNVPATQPTRSADRRLAN